MVLCSISGSKQVGLVRDIKTALRLGNHNKASLLSRELITLALKGLNYYQNYDRVFLNTIVSLGLVGWIIYIVLWIVQTHTDILAHSIPVKSFLQERHIDVLFLTFGLVGALLLVIQSAPFMYYIYCSLPFLFWNHISKKADIFQSIYGYIVGQKVLKRLFLTVIFGLLSLETLVLSFFQREILSIGLTLFSLWVLSTKLDCHTTKVCWMVMAAIVAVFPMLPVVGREASYTLVTLAGILSVIVFMAFLIYCSKVSVDFKAEVLKCSKILIYQFLSISVAVYNVNTTAASLKEKRGLPIINQISSWVILLLAFLVPVFSSRNLILRMTSITLGLISAYLLMSTSYEGLFLLGLSLLVLFWIIIEHKLTNGTLESLLSIRIGEDSKSGPSWKLLTNGLNDAVVRPLTLEDLRCSYFFVFFIITAFFGTGNIASINSFDPSSVYCFMTVFSPFMMGSLLLCKVFIPFVIVTSAFDAIHVILQVPVYSLFLVVLVFTDIMGLHFFFLVKDYGSWLEIGTSISHYVIMMTFIIFLFLIFGLTRLFTGASIALTDNKKKS